LKTKNFEDVKMIKVVSSTICPFVQRVTALLEQKKIPYDIEYISLLDKPDWFMRMSPNAQVPILITESGATLFESDAIVEYLEEAYPSLQPSVDAEARAMDRAWSYLATKNYLVQCAAQRSKDEETLVERTEKLGKAFAIIEGTLGEGPYFRGADISVVDIAWLPLLHRAALIERHTGYDFLAGYPLVKKWQHDLMKTGLAERSVADDFESAFTGFYLSESTFLGNGDATCCEQTAKRCGVANCC
jgi:glutathione S-transferase